MGWGDFWSEQVRFFIFILNRTVEFGQVLNISYNAAITGEGIRHLGKKLTLNLFTFHNDALVPMHFAIWVLMNFLFHEKFSFFQINSFFHLFLSFHRIYQYMKVWCRLYLYYYICRWISGFHIIMVRKDDLGVFEK